MMRNPTLLLAIAIAIASILSRAGGVRAAAWSYDRRVCGCAGTSGHGARGGRAVHANGARREAPPIVSLFI